MTTTQKDGKPLFGDAAVKLGYVSKDAVNTALRDQAQLRQKGAASTPIGTLLAEKGLLTPGQITAVLRHLAHSNLPLSEDGIRLAARLKVLHAASSNIIGIAATEPGDAVVLASELAVAMAVMEQGQVMLVDADAHHSQVHRQFGLPATPGFMERVRAITADDQAPVGMPVPSMSGLSVLPWGQAAEDTASLSVSPEAGQLLNALRAQHRYIFVVLGDVLCHPEAAVTASRCDGMLLALRAGVSDKTQLGHVQQLLQGLKVPLSGVVVTKAAPRSTAPMRRKAA